MTQEEKHAINQQVKDIIRRSEIWSDGDRPETVAALMVLHVCMHLGVKHEDVPKVLLTTLSELGADRA